MRKSIILNITIFLVAILVFSGFQNQQDHRVLFEKAKYTMETKGELNEAVRLFEQIIKDYPKEREYAAKAQLHIGLCYEKLGKQQATEAYNKVISKYSDQLQTAEVAKNRLNYLKTQSIDTGKKEILKKSPVVAKIIYPDPHMSGDITPDGKYISDVDWTLGNMRINNVATGEKILITNEGTWKKPNIFGDHSVYSYDGKYLAYFWIIGESAQLRIHDFETGEYRILAQSDKMSSCPWPDEWTKDGKYILASGSDKEKNIGTIQLVSVADGSVKTIKTIKECPCAGVSISPDGKYVAITIGDKAVDRDIHIVAVDGSLDYKLIDFPGADWAPKWTPDGKKIIFASYRSGSPALWSVEMKDGQKVSDPSFVYEGISDNHLAMRFTADGKYIYSSSSAYSNVITASIDPENGTIGEPVTIMDDHLGRYSSAFWSPDGSKISYIVWKPQNWNSGNYVIIQDLKTGERKEVYPGEKKLEQNIMWSWPQWSDDGESILLRIQRGMFDFEPVLVNIETESKTYLKRNSWNIFGPQNSILCVDKDFNKIVQQDLNTKNEKVIYECDQQIFHLATSKDNSKLAFFTGEMGTGRTQRKLFVMSLDDYNVKMLWEAGEEQSFSWNTGVQFFPDGKTLFLALSEGNTLGNNIKSRQFYTFNIETLEKKKLGEEIINPPPSFEHIRLSPNGKKIAYCRTKQMGNIWSLEFEY